MHVKKQNFMARHGFTLVELLVVIAVTTVLFALLLIPLIQAVRLTQRAQILAAAQDSARKTTEQVAREAGSAVYVFDNASHPFVLTSGTFGANDDKFTNFLNLEVPTRTAGTYTVAHAYNAKLDFVPARRTGEGGNAPTDPTTPDKEPVTLTPSKTGGSADLTQNGALFPLAPGTTLVRYFVGLKRPVVYDSANNAAVGHYANSNERLGTGNDNTYVLYRAQVAPYTDTGGTRTPNSAYFATSPDGKAELDDPDFFRFVGRNDVNWLSDAHALYTGVQAAAHNARVGEWMKVAKPVITAPAIDLLILPHNPDGSIAFDTATDPFPGVPHQGTAHDPVQNADFPTVKTSVTFAPATLTADAAPASATAYPEQGVPNDAADNDGLPYVPTVYVSSSKSWGYPYNLSLYQYTSSGSVERYDTSVAAVSSNLGNLYVYAGDLVERYYPAPNTPVDVYDITQGVVLTKGTPDYSQNYVPLVVNPDTGTINFAVPALPAPPNMNSTVSRGGVTPFYDRYTRFWSVPDNASLNGGTLLATKDAANNPTPGVIDLTRLSADASGNGVLVTMGGYNASPLSELGQLGSGALSCANAFVVPGSVRVYGPDATPGPNLGSSVLYTPVSPAAPLGFNQYRVDYVHSTLSFFVTDAESLPVVKADGATAADPVRFAFDYQANLSPPDTTKIITNDPTPANYNPARPLPVKVDYQTRDLLDINIGVRVYDPTDGHPLTVPQSTRVQIGNPNR